jgi:hypothetical protein
LSKSNEFQNCDDEVVLSSERSRSATSDYIEDDPPVPHLDPACNFIPAPSSAVSEFHRPSTCFHPPPPLVMSPSFFPLPLFPPSFSCPLRCQFDEPPPAAGLHLAAAAAAAPDAGHGPAGVSFPASSPPAFSAAPFSVARPAAAAAAAVITDPALSHSPAGPAAGPGHVPSSPWGDVAPPRSDWSAGPGWGTGPIPLPACQREPPARAAAGGGDGAAPPPSRWEIKPVAAAAGGGRAAAAAAAGGPPPGRAGSSPVPGDDPFHGDWPYW